MAEDVPRPRGPAPVTKNPISLLSYMRRMRDGAAEIVEARFEQYGDIYYAPFLGRDVYVLRHPDHIREVLVTQAAKFGKPTSGMTARQLDKLLGKGLLNANGDAWRRRRRLIQPAFQPRRLEAYARTVASHTADAVSSWRAGDEVDLSREMMELTLRIVSKALFDYEVTSEGDRVAAAMRAFRDTFGEAATLLPDWAPVPGKRRIRMALMEIDALVFGLIDGHRPNEGDGGDLLSGLLEARKGEDGLTRRELRDELLTLFLAGHETTSHALTWTFYLLSEHPDVERRVRAEVATLTQGRAPGWQDLGGLVYTGQVLEEAMRLYPPAYAIPRTAVAESKVGGFDIPVGADVVIWIHHVHHDERWFPDPERFDPGRFTAARKKALHQCAYLPFGAGQRSCVGKQFAIMEAKLILARVLQDWTFRLKPGHEVRPHMAVTMAPAGGLPVIARRVD